MPVEYQTQDLPTLLFTFEADVDKIMDDDTKDLRANTWRQNIGKICVEVFVEVDNKPWWGFLFHSWKE